MDRKNVGMTISSLRKNAGITQLQLAERLGVSCKTVSKWECGLGFPDITQFPELARIFGVSVEYIMTGERSGIAIVGNILADLVKNIDSYPEIGLLSNIRSISRSVGGCVPNTGINLAKISRSIPIKAIGRIGDDEYGSYVISQLQRYGINTERVSISPTKPTSFSDVMNIPSGERTFFHARGANAEFSPEYIDLSKLNCRLLHIGYVLLLDKFDEADDEYGTVMARFLRDVQERGIKTSIDAVSDCTADYGAKLLPALRYCDYAILNEIESCSIWNISPYKESDGNIDVDIICDVMKRMAEAGVREKIVIHSKKVGFCYNVKTGRTTIVPSLNIPPEEIKGSVGAGDAFCAGCLYGIYEGLEDKEMLEFASAAAACNLFAENAIDGMKPHEEILKMSEKYRRLPL